VVWQSAALKERTDRPVPCPATFTVKRWRLNTRNPALDARRLSLTGARGSLLGRRGVSGWRPSLPFVDFFHGNFTAANNTLEKYNLARLQAVSQLS
jgi:hypothetical protein